MTEPGNLTDLLAELRAELQVQNNPDRLANASLKPNRHGWTAEPYSEEAFRLWDKLHRRSPDDVHVLHHLAIMHHARAFDLEQSDDPRNADPDWKRSLELWHELHGRPEFWDGIGEQFDHGVRDVLPAVCAELPERLLQIHFDIAADGQTKHYRRRVHVGHALSSGFARDVKDRVRLRSYERWVSDVPVSVWSSDMFDQDALQSAVDRVAGYLDIDEDFRGALTDLMGLLVNLMVAKVQETNAAGSDEEHDQQLNRILALGERYRAHVSRLETLLGVPVVAQGADPAAVLPAEPAPSATTDDSWGKLRRWHSLLGQASYMLEDHDAAMESHWRAVVRATVPGTDGEAIAESRRAWSRAVARAAFDSVYENEQGRGEATRLLALLDGHDEFDAAGLLFRAQVHIGLRDLDRADADLDRADRLVLPGEPGGIDAALTRVRAESAKLRALLRDYGGGASFDLRQKAFDALNGDDPEKAVSLMREAMRSASAGTSRTNLDKDFAVCLNAAGVKLFNDAASPAGAVHRMRTTNLFDDVYRAERLFTEALEHDRGNRNVKTNLTTIQKFIYQLGGRGRL